MHVMVTAGFKEKAIQGLDNSEAEGTDKLCIELVVSAKSSSEDEEMAFWAWCPCIKHTLIHLLSSAT